jgi:pyridoxine 5'-phosphate synthase PdxJ
MVILFTDMHINIATKLLNIEMKETKEMVHISLNTEFSSVMLPSDHVRWAPVTTAWHVCRLWMKEATRYEEAVDILNKQSWTDNM